MPATSDDIFARLNDLGIDYETHEHVPVFTVEEAREHCGHLPGCHSKNLFVKDKKGVLWLIVARDDAPIRLSQLEKEIGAKRLSFGKPDLLMEVMGVVPGAVTPFGLINDTEVRVNVILDEKLMAADIVNFHPLSNDRTTALAPADLLRCIESFGHQPRVMDVDAVME
ncbi:MAG: prolyl-tRNA synthetase associated domain-containing protein [Pseudomonadota bacterium]